MSSGENADPIGQIIDAIRERKVIPIKSGGDWQQTAIGMRRERDSNPRYVLPYTHFPGVLLKPLGHLSGKVRLSFEV